MHTIQRTNLRPSGDSLTPMAIPSVLASSVSKALLQFTGSRGHRHLIILNRNGSISVINGTVIEPLGRMGGGNIPSCAVMCENRVIFMPQNPGVPETALYDPKTDSWLWMGPMPELDTIGLVAQEQQLISVPIPAMEFSGSYNGRSASLNATDAKTLSETLTAAYETICSQASWSHAHIQPVMARYRLIGPDGLTLYESAPKLLTAPSGVQAAGISSLISLSGSTASLAPSSLSTRSFKVALQLPENLSQDFQILVRRIEILVSPDIHPISLQGVGLNAMAGGKISAFLPGIPLTGTAQIAQKGSLMRSRILTTLCHMDSLLLPADDGFNPLWPTLKEQVTNIDRLASAKTFAHEKTQLSFFSTPHIFNASSVSVSGETVVWGNLSVRLFSGYSPAEMAVLTADGLVSQTTVSVITLSNGSQITGHSRNRFTASSLSPLLLYPLAQAKSLQLQIDDKRETLQLEPSPDGLWAVAIRDDCKPWMPQTQADEISATLSDPVVLTYDSYIVSASVSDPLKPLAAGSIGSGGIVAIEPAIRSASAWDFARSHFYAFASSGSHQIAVSKARNHISASVIDSRPVTSTDHIAPAPTAILAVAGNDLIKITGGAAKTLLPDITPSHLGFNPRFQEIWLSGKVYDLTGHYISHRDDIEPTTFFNLPGSLYLTDADGTLYDCCNELSQVADIALTVTKEIPPDKPLNSLQTQIYGMARGLKISWYGHNSPYELDSSLPLTCITLRGPMDAPLRIPISWPRRCWATMVIHGHLDRGGRIIPNF